MLPAPLQGAFALHGFRGRRAGAWQPLRLPPAIVPAPLRGAQIQTAPTITQLCLLTQSKFRNL